MITRRSIVTLALSRYTRVHSFSSMMQTYMDDGTFWYNLALLESFCLRKLMKYCGSLKAVKGLEAPDDLESFLKYKIDQIHHRVGATGQ
jgi:hypothetical protein